MHSQGEDQEVQNVHFTYKANPDMSSLCQGDVLKRTDELMAILTDAHPYFCNDEYKHFMVLSQSCDLVCRNGNSCKTPYITIAAVREYSNFLERTLLANHFADNYNGYLLVKEKQKPRVFQLLERVYNNTEPDYFFLYKEDKLEFPKSMVAYLKVSIALKSEKHYQELLKAKMLELSDEFKAKLGWLVGNMYSRVGTTDWESKMTDKERTQMIENDICSHCIVGTPEQLNELKRNLIPQKLNTHDDIQSFLSSIKVPDKYEQLMNTVEEIICHAPKTVTEDDRQFLLRAFKSRTKIKQIMKSI